MDLTDLDMNLLVVFHAVLHEKSVTHASRKLGVSQPAVSYALARLRRLLADPLFVRIGHAMHPTPRAKILGESVGRILDIVNAEVLQRVTFDPGTAGRTFTLCMSDIGETIFAPPSSGRRRIRFSGSRLIFMLAQGGLQI